MITQKEIAEILGLSRATISRALRNDPDLRISEETKEKIFSLANEKGYKNKSKPTIQQHNILIIHKESHFLSQIDNAFYFAIRNGIEETCHERNINFNYITISQLDTLSTHYNLVIIVGNYNKDVQQNILESDCFEEAQFIHIGKVNFFPNKFHSISYNLSAATDIAIANTLHHSFDNYYYIGTSETYGAHETLLENYHFVRSLENAGRSFSAIHLVEFGTESGYEAMKTLSENNLSNACIICANDPIAIGALQYLNVINIAVPSNTSIVSMNGDQNSQFIFPRLSTVNFNARVMGHEAIMLALRLLNEDLKLMMSINLYPSFIHGGSIIE